MVAAGVSIISKDAADDARGTLVAILSSGTVDRVNKKNKASGHTLVIAGTGTMLVSIPFFVASSKNKSKRALMLKDEVVFFTPHLNIKKYIPAVGVRINY
jgi:adenylosuccinate synthase